MPVASGMDLINALAIDDFNRLLGTPESAWLDFKRAPYQLDASRGKWELAKDVAAFSNLGGGFIVIGVETQRHLNSVEETASAVPLTAKARLNPSQYRHVVDSWVYPQVRNMQLQWFPGDPNQKEGLFVIEIPAQADADKFFIVRRMVDDIQGETGAVGIPLRDGDRVAWLPAERIHHLISAGRIPPTTPAPVAHGDQEDLRQRGDHRILQIEDLEDWEEAPVFALQALPPAGGPEQLPGLYEHDGLRGLLASPRGLRPSGFGWRTGADPEVIEGSLLCRRGGRAVWLDSDGLLTAAVVVNRDTLGWALNDNAPQGAPLRVNPIALVEMTFEFFRFVHNELATRIESKNWSFVLRCKRLRRAQVVLSPGWHDRGLGMDEPREASSDDWVRRFTSEGAHQRDAFVALARIYALWGLAESDIPFTENLEVPDSEIQSL